MSDVDPLIRKSVVARDYRGVTTRQLHTLIKRNDWPAPDVRANKHGAPDYYFRSTAEKARAKFLSGR